MASYTAPGAAGKGMAALKAELLKSSAEDAMPAANVERAIDLRTNETFTVRRSVDFSHSFDELAADPSKRVWKTNPDHTFLKPGDKVIANQIRVVNTKNSSDLPLGVKFTGLDVNRTQIVGAQYKRADVDVMLAPRSESAAPRDLYVLTESRAMMALHPNVVNSQLADLTEAELNKGIAHHDEKSNGDMIVANSILGADILMHVQQGNIVNDGIDFDIIPADKPGAQDLLLVHNSITEQIKANILSERAKLPFRDPSAVTAELVRLDGKEFNNSDGLVSIGSVMEGLQMKEATAQFNQISVEIEETYTVARAVQ